RSDPPQYFTHKLYRDPEGKPVTVHYCTNFKKAEELCKPFLKEKVVGFDMEWESYASPEDTIKRNISVMQVASESTVVVFHIAQFQGGNTTKELIPPSLISLIESRDVIKTGVAVWTADGKRIQKFLGLNPRGFVELSHFFHVLQNTRTASGTYPKNLCALATQIKTYIGFPLPKVGRIRCGNWSRGLNLAQVDYAAADAYAGLALYHIMNEKRKQLRPTPPHPRFAELGLPI
ncbi:ribonuclease H-like domain-containing protein, partial [Phyllosticta citribraziliensis]